MINIALFHVIYIKKYYIKMNQDKYVMRIVQKIIMKINIHLTKHVFYLVQIIIVQMKKEFVIKMNMSITYILMKQLGDTNIMKMICILKIILI